MKNVLYVGNALSQSGKNKTSIETLGRHLKEDYNIKIASIQPNVILRLLDMMGLILKNKKNTDRVLIDTYSTFNFYYALIISQLCRVFSLDYIPILHGGNLENRLKNSPWLSKLIFKNAKYLVAPSSYLKSKFEAYGYNNLVFIPNTIQIKNYEFQSRTIETIKLLWVRSFVEIYNPKLAILVLETLVKRGYKAELTMVGPDVGNYLSDLKSLAISKNLTVNFTGKLTQLEWVTRSKTHNIFINTANFDNTPVSVIEAMALGLPIVSTNVGGLSVLIENEQEGLLVEPNNTDAMTNAILRLREDTILRDKLIFNGRLKAEHFDWSLLKKHWHKLLN